MNKENLNLFQQIVQAHNITCTIVEKDFSNLYKTDLELRYKLYSDYDYLLRFVSAPFFRNLFRSHLCCAQYRQRDRRS